MSREPEPIYEINTNPDEEPEYTSGSSPEDYFKGIVQGSTYIETVAHVPRHVDEKDISAVMQCGDVFNTGIPPMIGDLGAEFFGVFSAIFGFDEKVKKVDAGTLYYNSRTRAENYVSKMKASRTKNAGVTA